MLWLREWGLTPAEGQRRSAFLIDATIRTVIANPLIPTKETPETRHKLESTHHE